MHIGVDRPGEGREMAGGQVPGRQRGGEGGLGVVGSESISQRSTPTDIPPMPLTLHLF